jgi:Flavoprotein
MAEEAQVERRPVLYVVASGAAPARELPVFIPALTGDWDTCVITTPEGSRFLDLARLTALTGHPVRTSFKDPDAPDVLPPADAFAAAPATFNTINKWAAGISDTLALGLPNEATGLGLPMERGPGPAGARSPVRPPSQLPGLITDTATGRDVDEARRLR